MGFVLFPLKYSDPHRLAKTHAVMPNPKKGMKASAACDDLCPGGHSDVMIHWESKASTNDV